MGQRQSTAQQPALQQQQHPAQRTTRCEASAAEAPSAAPGSTVQIGNDSKRKLTYVSYEANSWQATFEQTGAPVLREHVACNSEHIVAASLHAVLASIWSAVKRAAKRRRSGCTAYAYDRCSGDLNRQLNGPDAVQVSNMGRAHPMP